MSKKFKLDNNKITALKKICKEENSIQIDSNYGGKRFGFIISKEWKNNNKIFFQEDEIGRFHIESYFKMITEFNPITEKFIKKYSLTDAHINLLRKCYFSYYIHDEVGLELSDDIDGVLMLDYKRPFGNSDVMGDVFYEFDIDIYDDEFNSVNIEANYEYLIDESILNIFNYLIEEDFDKTLAIQSKNRRYWSMELVPNNKISFLDKIINKIKNVW